MDPEWLRDWFGEFGPIAVRCMFGGQAIYADSVMFGLVARDQLWIKADDATRAQFEAAGSRPFSYDRGMRRVQLTYWSVPNEAMDDPSILARWARLGLAAARRSRFERRRTPAPVN